MDDTAQNPQTQQNQPNMQGQPTQAQSGQNPVAPAPPAVPQQPVSPITQPQNPSRGPEQGPVGSGLPPREAAPVDEAEAITAASDDSAVQPDEAVDAADAKQQEAVDVKLQEQPQVEVSAELEKVGVDQGEDANPEHLPGEQLATPDEKAAQPDTQASAVGISLATPPAQLEEVKQKNGIRNAVRWLVTEVDRQLKKMKLKPEDQKTSW